MKPLQIATFLAVALIATNVYAQRGQGQSREEMMNQRIQRLDKVLNLTDDQVAKIKELYSQGGQRPQGGERPQGGQRPQGVTGRTGGRMGMMNTGIEEILTPDQVKAYRQYQIDENVDRRLNMIDDRIILKDAQKKSVRSILVKEAEENRTMMEKMQQSENTDRRAGFQMMQELRKKTDEAILKVLDKNQTNQYKSMMNNQQRRRPQR